VVNTGYGRTESVQLSNTSVVVAFGIIKDLKLVAASTRGKYELGIGL